MNRKLLLFFLLWLPFASWAKEGERRETVLYKSLNPKSLSELLAFYELYPKSPEGIEALQKAYKLLNPHEELSNSEKISLPKLQILPLIALVNRNSEENLPLMKKEELEPIQKAASSLANRKLKTYGCWKESDFLLAESKDVDLSRGLLIALWGEGSEVEQKILCYEALLDLMALQIQANLSSEPSHLEKIHAINHFIFFELGFRFPPHSIYAKNIDTFTFLPSVMDNRKGVCLGVSILYLCLAQRLDLPLEIITPPGHVYVRYREGKKITNIETTARGIDLPSELYLSIETKKLQQRNIKETIGLAFANQAAVLWTQKNYPQAIFFYEKALTYIPDDPLLKEFLAYNYLFSHRKADAKKLFLELSSLPAPYETCKNTIVEDFLNGNANAEGIETIFLPVDENRSSILEKQLKLLDLLQKHPHFRAGLLQLATCYLQLGREKEAYIVLKQYQEVDDSSPLVNYYLTQLSLERHDHNAAWKFYNKAFSLLKEQGYCPKVLRDLKIALRQISPPPETF